MNELRLLPSLLSANFANLESQIDKLLDAKIRGLHYDVMDGNFVNNISFGQKILSDLSKNYSEMYFDVHLMILNPEKYIEEFIASGANAITWHIEVDVNHKKLIEICKAKNVKSGIAINPETDITKITHLINSGDIDQILVMSVKPGHGGQSFIENTFNRILAIRNLIDKASNNKIKILVDGGVNYQNFEKIFEYGANTIIAGNTIFKDLDSFIKRYKENNN